ncbi:MAG: 4'-phosphopantetheinyl transferase superfamily protein [Propionibacteriaceae bacterium]|nr:4'-phosphopantetheinyl transferase superfamily protein [Propionibacteriaceae bacterium]
MTEPFIAVERGAPDAHEVLRQAVAEELGLDAAHLEVTHHCPRCGSSAHGVPALSQHGSPIPVAVSISRADGVVLVAFTPTVPSSPSTPNTCSATTPNTSSATTPGATNATHIGIDIERTEAAADSTLDGVLRHPEEPPYPDAHARTRAWVRKEAALKAWGTGLNLEPSEVLDLGTHATAPGLPTATLQDLEIDGYQAAVAVITAPWAASR